MVSRTQRLVFLGIALVIAVVVVIVVASGGSDKSGGGFTKGVVTLDGNGVKTIKVHQNDQVTFKATSQKADEVHLHGYDVHKDVPAGGTVTFSLKATIQGIFEIEYENQKKQIGQLVVEP